VTFEFEVQDALGHRWTTLYSLAGQPTASIDPLGHRTSTMWSTGLHVGSASLYRDRLHPP
jgi:hypothetical protein